jgi:beta-lactam-binding protein with PASTA domain
MEEFDPLSAIQVTVDSCGSRSSSHSDSPCVSGDSRDDHTRPWGAVIVLRGDFDVDGGHNMTEPQPASEQSRGQYRWGANFGIGAVGGLALAVVTLLVVIALWATQRESQVEVPTLIGMSRVNAEALLKDAGLNLGATSDEVSDQPVGTVLRTDPVAGAAIDQGAGVSLVLAIPVPAPAGSGNAEPPAEAPAADPEPPAAAPQARTEGSAQVVAGPIVVPPQVVVPPPVVASPPVVVYPPAPVPPPAPTLQPVPDVVGFDRSRAGRVLTDHRLSVGSVSEEVSAQHPGTVLWTNPRAGIAVRPGTPVDLVIAKRREVVVPAVVGLDRPRAARVLADEGLSVGSVTEEVSAQQPGTVLRTTPRAGTAVLPGSSINLVIAKRQQVVVRNVVGMDRAQATRVLTADGLSVGSVTEKESSKPAGTVLETDPTAGTTVSPGSAVNLVVAKAAKPKDPKPNDPKPENPKPKDPKDPTPKAGPANGSGTDGEATRSPSADRHRSDR